MIVLTWDFLASYLASTKNPYLTTERAGSGCCCMSDEKGVCLLKGAALLEEKT